MDAAWLSTSLSAALMVVVSAVGIYFALMLLVDGERVLWENLRVARMTEGDLRAKLREADVLDPAEIRAVVMESTGDVSVLHGEPGGTALDAGLLEDVQGA